MKCLNNKINLVAFSFILLLAFACKKDPPIDPLPTEPVMPPLTHQGLNTFGCYIDGELFVAGGGNSYWDLPPVNGSFDEESKKIIIRATKYTKTENDISEYIDFRAFLADEIGEYNYWYNEEYGSDGYTNWGGDRCDYYFQTLPDFDLGKLTITHLDEEKNIVSGTFYMNLINENCDGDTLMKITDGRFDMRY